MKVDEVVAVVGLGYVGLPLAVEFGKKGRTIGFDLSSAKVESYKRFIDPTGELASDDLKASRHLEVTTDPAMLAQADYIVVAVPTPVDIAHNPDFTPLIGASKSVGKNMKRGAVVVYESTVYPGATEEVCIPILERESGLKWKEDFHVGLGRWDEKGQVLRVPYLLVDVPGTFELHLKDGKWSFHPDRGEMHVNWWRPLKQVAATRPAE